MSQIILEFTEHEPISDPSALLRLLNPLFDQGLELSIDDVGAGFASMRLICELHPHFIKVDRFFISGIAQNQVKQSMISNFVNLASDLGTKIVAEGVERCEDGQMVIQLGVGLVQGHLFGRPRARPNFSPLPENFWKTLQADVYKASE